MAILAEYPDISADAVCQKTQMEKSIVSRAVSKLLHRTLIIREFDSKDKRRSILRLSDTGNAVYDEIIPVSMQYEAQIRSSFTDQEYQQLSQLFEKLQRGVRDGDQN